MVRVKVNERIYTLTLEEFMKSLGNMISKGCVEVIDYPCNV